MINLEQEEELNICHFEPRMVVCIVYCDLCTFEKAVLSDSSKPDRNMASSHFHHGLYIIVLSPDPTNL